MIAIPMIATDRDPALYGLKDDIHQNLWLYEERLIAGKNRAKTGEVTVGKHVETETTKVSVPIEKERVVIERTTPTGDGTAVTPSDSTFKEGEVARMEVYEETPDIRKEAFVREEVSVRKQVDQQTVNAEESLRREELDVSPEAKQLAAIDLGQTQETEFDTLKVAGGMSSPTVEGRFISVNAAIQFLQGIAEQSSPSLQSVRVIIALEDASFQAIYQRWLENGSNDLPFQ